MSLPRSPVMALLVGFALVASGRAHAELGGSLLTVQADGPRTGAQITSLPMGRFTRHILTRANGGTVHELTNPSGQVFAVTWSGPGKPDLRTLLGRYFATLQAASAGTGHAMRSLRHPQQVNRPDVHIQTAGHMGWFRGVAFIPSLAPAGFTPGDLAQEP